MTLAAFSQTCGNIDAGGIQSLWVTEIDNVVSMTLGTGTTNIYETITMVTGEVFYKYDFYEETASFKEDGTRNENGNISYLQSIEFFIKGIRAESSDAINDLATASSCGMCAIALLTNGQYVVTGYSEEFGLNKPCRFQTDATDGGKLIEDTSGNTITLQAKSTVKAYFTTATIPV